MALNCRFVSHASPAFHQPAYVPAAGCLWLVTDFWIRLAPAAFFTQRAQVADNAPSSIGRFLSSGA